ncbi:MAG: hypothetical protein U0822_28435 [Anaerolineae bacterium]
MSLDPELLDGLLSALVDEGDEGDDVSDFSSFFPLPPLVPVMAFD